MIKATSIVTALGVALSSFALAATPVRAGNAGGVIAGGIVGFAAGAIVGNQLAKRKNHAYRAPAPGRSAEERAYWMDIQDALNTLGYNAGPVDGAPGRRTRQAIREFQRSIPDVPDGKLTPEQTQLLFSRAYPQPAPGEGVAPAAGDPAQPGPVSPDASAASVPAGGFAPPQPGSGQVLQTEPAQPGTPPAPTATAASVSAPAEAQPAAGQPQIQVDENGRQFIEVNGEKFFLETKE
ncbi:peptidoglycan-binding domain-containing protein [Roseibium sp.]|uniref:peptidoglycan-binding domain-containing protein n=1 Tax=Roseibium sp. TaxID=1936156 RepID=UPI003A970D8C